MTGRPTVIRQRDSKQILNAAKKAGAKRVEFRIGDVPVIVHLTEPDQSLAAKDEQITL